VLYVYGQLGIPLPHASSIQYTIGKRIAQADLLPGDLVFFDPGPIGPGHVGIYIGDGKFVQAPRTGDVVKISRLSDYAFRYVGATRPY
jgi:cell wall-associated NlpC family hydrolase